MWGTLTRSDTKWPRKRAQRWYFTVRADNGKILATSENYVNRGDALKALLSILEGKREAYVIDENAVRIPATEM